MKTKIYSTVLTLILLFSSITHASFIDFQSEQWVDNALTNKIAQYSLTGDPREHRTIPSINTPKAQLGKLLFFSKIQSGNFDTACVSCHHPTLGGADALSIAIGVDSVNPDLLGPGRQHRSTAVNYDGGPTMPRNVPTSFNLGFWDRHLFHDGRVEALLPVPFQHGAIGPISTPDSGIGNPDSDAGANLSHAQAGFPITPHEEMRGFSFAQDKSNQEIRDLIAARLRGELEPLSINQWPTLFRQTFNKQDAPLEEVINSATIREVLGEYMRSQSFVDNRWYQYIKGDKAALSLQEKRGALKFFAGRFEGGFDCQSCHQGDLMTDEGFHNIAMPQIGRGKEDGETGTHDFGRYRETLLFRDAYAFRTPSLLNVEMTSPYGHSGAFNTLEGVIRHHMDPFYSGVLYTYDGPQPNIQQADRRANTYEALWTMFFQQAMGLSKLKSPYFYGSTDINDLASFLRALTDPCTQNRECLEPWLVDDDIDPDGLRVHAVDSNLNPL
ncbi:methylamine utilization protein MauG [Grimontia sp. AD028]|uniref:cytochrome-c peroxidase n=1 Tax=Grimontia sp. AD028 TaxID=1581149 RepID=UPI00061B162D|nr:cytochrome c peroxidase [Grimontia sp. AD028]KKD59849.1 methylamine utilization protein MauG [Grimontia sp. AD028]